MAHLVAAASHRLGKSFLWPYNVLIPTQQNIELNNNLTLNYGLRKLMKHILRRKRLFLVKFSLRYSLNKSKFYCNVLFMPRIKTKPKPDSRGTFAKFVLYKHLN